MKKEKNSKNDTKLKFLDQNKGNKQENFKSPKKKQENFEYHDER